MSNIMCIWDTIKIPGVDVSSEKAISHVGAAARASILDALVWAPWGPAVRECLKTGEVCFIAQKIVDSTGKEKKQELLARLGYEGTVSPYIFIPIIEATGNNNVFDYIVVEEVFRRISQNASTITVPCAININPSTFEHGDYFFGYVERLRKIYQIDPSKIILEILETEPINDYPRFNEILARFRKKGYSIAVDDFHPIGNHNIFCVDNLFEIDTVKFDGIYMCEIYAHRGEERVTQELKDTLKNIMDKHSHIDFVIEKIEDVEMFECFRTLFEYLDIAERVSYQGYYFDQGSFF